MILSIVGIKKCKGQSRQFVKIGILGRDNLFKSFGPLKTKLVDILLLGSGRVGFKIGDGGVGVKMKLGACVR